MTSNYYTDPSKDYSHMYNIKDVQGPLPYPLFNPNTILGFLLTDPGLKEYFDLVSSNKLISGLYNNEQAEFTIFAPLNCRNIRPDNIDSYDLTKLLRYHSLEKTITPEFLGSVGSTLLSTKHWSKNIFVENRLCNNKKYTFLNEGQAMVLGYKAIGKSNIFIIDNVLSEFNKVL
jgi:hypothetical protein